MPESCRIVNAHYLAPDHPGRGAAALRRRRRRASSRSTTSPGWRRRRASTWSSARARPRPTRSSGCSDRGVDPDAICWVRPRDPWMLNRALVQPDPAIFLGLAADIMQAAAASSSLDARSSGWRTPASCCASTASSCRRWPRRRRLASGSSSCCARRGRRTPWARPLGLPRPARARRRLGRDRPRRARRALRRRRAEVPALLPLWRPERSPRSRSGPASPASAPRWRVRRGHP